MDDQDWSRLARYLAGECTPDEVLATERWLLVDPDRQRAHEAMRVAFAEAAVPPVEWNTEAAALRLTRRRGQLHRPSQATHARRSSRWIRGGIAAALVGIALHGASWYRGRPVA